MRRRDLLKAGAAFAAAGCARWRPIEPPGPSVPHPSPSQLRWQDAEVGMFVHFGVNTYTDREWGLGNEDPKSFNPTNLDARAWVAAAKSAGCRYIVLTAKHHDGFCLWPSRVTLHTVRSSPWRGGQGDVVRDVADAARTGGLGLGLYLSPWDRNASSYGLGNDYNDFYIAQLTELLTNYGPLTEVWFDGANGEGPNGRRQRYDWARIHATVRKLQPNAVMFSDAGPDVRWIGNERGVAGDPNWCTVDPSIVTEPGLDGPHIIQALQHGNPPPQGTVWRPGEAPVSIRPGWFHHAAEDARVKTPSQLMELWFNCVGRNANLLLNVPPARDGTFGDADVHALRDFGAAQRTFWEGGETYRDLPSDGDAFEVALRRPARVRAVSLHEPIARGQRVSAYRVEALAGGEWRLCARGTTIGHRKVDRFDPVETRRLRVVVEGSLGTPRLSAVQVGVA